jgi:hypothetical protein
MKKVLSTVMLACGILAAYAFVPTAQIEVSAFNGCLVEECESDLQCMPSCDNCKDDTTWEPGECVWP